MFSWHFPTIFVGSAWATPFSLNWQINFRECCENWFLVSRRKLWGNFFLGDLCFGFFLQHLSQKIIPPLAKTLDWAVKQDSVSHWINLGKHFILENFETLSVLSVFEQKVCNFYRCPRGGFVKSAIYMSSAILWAKVFCFQKRKRISFQFFLRWGVLFIFLVENLARVIKLHSTTPEKRFFWKRRSFQNPKIW